MIFSRELPKDAWHAGWNQAEWTRYRQRLAVLAAVLAALIAARLSI